MLNIFDPLFKLSDEDLLSVDENGPLNRNNIDGTITNMVKSISQSMGYNTCTQFNIDNFSQLDNLYLQYPEEGEINLYSATKSIVIPIFNEKVNNNKLLNELTNANVSFIVITPKNDRINGISSNEPKYSITDGTGNPSSGSELNYNRLTNIRFYRYANIDNEHKYDYNPCYLDIIAPIYYGYYDIDNIKEVKVCIQNCFNFYMNQQIMEGLPNLLPFLPTEFNKYTVYDSGNIGPLNGNPLFSDRIQINDFSQLQNRLYCHIYNNFYCLSNEEE